MRPCSRMNRDRGAYPRIPHAWYRRSSHCKARARSNFDTIGSEIVAEIFSEDAIMFADALKTAFLGAVLAVSVVLLSACSSAPGSVAQVSQSSVSATDSG